MSESLAKKIVKEKAAQTDGIVAELLNLRLELSKTSVKKYEAMARTICKDGRIHGLLQFGGASRTFRWARLVQVQNLPQNHLPDLDLAREIVKNGDEEMLDALYGSVPSSEGVYMRHVGSLRDGEWVFAVVLDVDCPDGVHAAQIVIDSVHPMSFVLN